MQSALAGRQRRSSGWLNQTRPASRNASTTIRTMVQAQSACRSPACLSSQYSVATTLSSVRGLIMHNSGRTSGSRLWGRSHLAKESGSVLDHFRAPRYRR